MIRKTDSIVFRASDVAEPLGDRVTRRLSPGLVAKRDLGRYYAVLDDALARVQFTLSEAVTLCRVLNGTLADPPATLALVWASVADAAPAEIEPGCDQAALVARLRSLSFAGQAAVVDAVERFWAGDYAADSVEVALARVGLARAVVTTATNDDDGRLP